MQKMEAQWFPQYLPFGSVEFVDNTGTRSGGRGAVARPSRSLPNFPILFIGLRITNTFEIPQDPTLTDLATYEACKRFLDNEQTVFVNLSQQNITAEATMQSQLTGNGGIYWSPFAVPFPMAGANNIALDITRRTPYPNIGGSPVLPVVDVTIIAAQARTGPQTMPPMRVGGYDANQYLQQGGQ
jgi:hypothetical protein